MRTINSEVAEPESAIDGMEDDEYLRGLVSDDPYGLEDSLDTILDPDWEMEF